jgi:hypothetical protein
MYIRNLWNGAGFLPRGSNSCLASPCESGAGGCGRGPIAQWSLERDCRKRIRTESEQSQTISWGTSTKPPEFPSQRHRPTELFTESERFTAIDRQGSEPKLGAQKSGRRPTSWLSSSARSSPGRNAEGWWVGAHDRCSLAPFLRRCSIRPALLTLLFWWSRSRECPRASRYRRPWPRNVDWTLCKVHRGWLTAGFTLVWGNAVAGLAAAFGAAKREENEGFGVGELVRLRWRHVTVIGGWMLLSASEARNRPRALGRFWQK